LRRFIWIPVLVLLVLCMTGAAATPEVYFQMKDPPGDEHGYGAYQYPSNLAFKPYQGLFDITEFKVWQEKPGEIAFDTAFANNTNPWMAPEGFIHQNLRVFVDSLPNQGATGLMHQGAYVRFDAKYAWDFCLRIAGWGNSQLITATADQKWQIRPLRTMMMGDNRTLRAVVPEKLVGKPGRNWHYYVLVGSYDGFGEDFFRRVMKDPGEWVIGGGYDEVLEPQVMDIVAADNASQVKQLRSFDLQTGQLAMLQPVGADLAGWRLPGWLRILLLLLLVVLIGFLTYRLIKRRGQISWFWVPNRESKTKKGA